MAAQSEDGFKKMVEDEDLLKKICREFKSPASDVPMFVERSLAILEAAAEEDALLNKQSRPALKKLRYLPLLNTLISDQQLLSESLNRGLLRVLALWLQRNPDGALPDETIRSFILKSLTTKIPSINLKLLVKSGIGKALDLLKASEETSSNKKLASDLLINWIASLYHNQTTTTTTNSMPPPVKVQCKKKQPAGGHKRLGVRERVTKRIRHLHSSSNRVFKNVAALVY